MRKKIIYVIMVWLPNGKGELAWRDAKSHLHSTWVGEHDDKKTGIELVDDWGKKYKLHEFKLVKRTITFQDEDVK